MGFPLRLNVSNTLDEGAAWLTEQTKVQMTPSNIVDLGVNGDVKLRVAIPPGHLKKSEGNDIGLNTWVLDGLLNFSPLDCHVLQVQGKIALDMATWSDAKGSNYVVRFTAPVMVTADMLRVSHSELKRLAELMRATALHEKSAGSHEISAVNSIKPKGGRPKEIEKKAEVLRKMIVSMTAGKTLDPGALPGSAADLLDACQRIQKAKTDGKMKEFNTSVATFKTWLKGAGYSIKTGRTPKNEKNFWTLLCVETMGKMLTDVFT